MDNLGIFLLIGGAGFLGYYIFSRPGVSTATGALLSDPNGFSFTSLGSDIENFFDSAIQLPVISGSGGTTLLNLSSANNAGIDLAAAVSIAQGKLIDREGNTLTVAPDNLGIPSVGIGHKVLTSDHLQVGDTITVPQRDAFFLADVTAAANAAVNQAVDLGTKNTEFVAALICVSFQLGANWPNVLYGTYAQLKAGNIQNAVQHIYDTAWYSQTPVRAQDFVEAIQNNYERDV